MKTMRFGILLLGFVTTNLWAQTTISCLQQTQIQQVLNTWRAQSNIPSATLSILLPNQSHPITFVSGKSTTANNEKTKADPLFQAGSITKSFTSTVVLQLESQGKLNINDPITKYLPQYARWHNVTIRQLLNHTSGIFNYTETGAFNNIRKTNPHAQFTPEEIVRLASEHPDYFAPGKGWKYSNTNYVLAGMIIQKVTKQPIATVMNHYLHQPKLELTNTFYQSGCYSPSLISRMVHGFSNDGHDVTRDNMSWASTAGAIVTTTQDLLAWWHDLFHNNILPAHQMAEMTSLVCEHTTPTCPAGGNMAHIAENGVGKGYGLGIIQSGYGSSRTGTVWWHNGSTKGYKAIVMWYPKSNIYIALTIDRDPGYLLKPELPAIQHILSILMGG